MAVQAPGESPTRCGLPPAASRSTPSVARPLCCARAVLGGRPLPQPVMQGTRRDRKQAMTREEVLTLVREHLAEELEVEASEIGEQTRFKEDLDADSLDLYELVME